MCVLGAACTGTDGQEATATTRTPATPAQREYRPTAGWRPAAPAEQGMDPAVLDDLDTQVPASSPNLRSLLVVGHVDLVDERYWRGLAADDGHNSWRPTSGRRWPGPQIPRATTLAAGSCGCRLLSWPRSGIWTATGAAGPGSRWSRPPLWPPRPGPTPTGRWVGGSGDQGG